MIFNGIRWSSHQLRPGIKELRGEILDAMTDTVHRMSPEVMARTLSGEAGSDPRFEMGSIPLTF